MFRTKMYLLIMVCDSCVHFLQKFGPTGLSKDNLYTNIERTKLTVIFGYIKSTIISPIGCSVLGELYFVNSEC